MNPHVKDILRSVPSTLKPLYHRKLLPGILLEMHGFSAAVSSVPAGFALGVGATRRVNSSGGLTTTIGLVMTFDHLVGRFEGSGDMNGKCPTGSLPDVLFRK